MLSFSFRQCVQASKVERKTQTYALIPSTAESENTGLTFYSGSQFPLPFLFFFSFEKMKDYVLHSFSNVFKVSLEDIPCADFLKKLYTSYYLELLFKASPFHTSYASVSRQQTVTYKILHLLIPSRSSCEKNRER